jgi:hypothetical protein
MKERMRDERKELINQYAGKAGQANSIVMYSHTRTYYEYTHAI